MTHHDASLCSIERLSNGVARRQDRGWSQEAFAFEAKLHRTYISDLERGARNPTLTVVEKLATALKVIPSVLVE